MKKKKRIEKKKKQRIPQHFSLFFFLSAACVTLTHVLSVSIHGQTKEKQKSLLFFFFPSFFHVIIEGKGSRCLGWKH